MTVTPSTEKPASGAPDFASAKSVVKMKPGADRYIGLLPADYNEMIPADIKAAFTGAKFEWGKIPDWIPPEGVR
jgi:nucleoporin NUP42